MATRQGFGFCCCGGSVSSTPSGGEVCGSILAKFSLTTKEIVWEAALPEDYGYAVGGFFGLPIHQARFLTYNKDHLGIYAEGITGFPNVQNSVLVYDRSGSIVSAVPCFTGSSSNNLRGCHRLFPETSLSTQPYHHGYVCMDESSNMYVCNGSTLSRCGPSGTNWTLFTAPQHAFIRYWGANWPNNSEDYTQVDDVFSDVDVCTICGFGGSADCDAFFRFTFETVFIDESTDQLYCVIKGVSLTGTEVNNSVSIICGLSKSTGLPSWTFVPLCEVPEIRSIYLDNPSATDEFVFATAKAGTIYCDFDRTFRFTLDSGGSLNGAYQQSCEMFTYACRGRVRHKAGKSYYMSYCDEAGNSYSSFDQVDADQQCGLLPVYDMGSFLSPSLVRGWYDSGVDVVNGTTFDSDGSNVFFLFPGCHPAPSGSTSRIDQYAEDGSLVESFPLSCPYTDIGHVSSSFESSEESFYEGDPDSLYLVY